MERQTPFQLPTFNGYTVDARLRQFRKVERGDSPKLEFINFDSEEGQGLLEEVREFFSFLFEEF
jgi:hypothetical protein